MKPRLLKAVAVGLLGLAGLLVIGAATRAMPFVRDMANQQGWSLDALGWSFGVLALQAVALIIAWHLLLAAAWPAGATVRLSVRSFVIGWISRYLPGPPTGPAGKFLVCRQAGMPGGALAASLWLEQCIQLAVSLALPAATVYFLFGPRALPFAAIAIVASGILAAGGARPAVIRQWVRVARWMRLSREVDHAPASHALVLRVALALALGGFLSALSFHVVAVTLTPWPVSHVGQAVCIFTAASLAGLVAPFAPSGAGVREAVIIALIGPAIGHAEAVSVALVTRAVAVSFDASLAGVLCGGSAVLSLHRLLASRRMSAKNSA